MLDKVEQPSGLQAFGMYINGASVGASNGKIMESLNPYSGKAWATVPDGSKEDIDAAVAAARAAFDHGPWSEMTATQRAASAAQARRHHQARMLKTWRDAKSRDNGKL